MAQITGAIIGITLVLMSVFVPMAFFPGSVGIIYRQFSVTMIAAIGISALMALSLTPALCATLLKPVEAGHHHEKRGLFGWFNRRMEAAKTGYGNLVSWTLLRTGRFMLIYRRAFSSALAGDSRGCRPAFCRSTIRASSRPTCRLPPEASFNRTLDAVKHVENYLLKRQGVEAVTFLTGFSFLGQGANTAQAFITLKDWSERGPNDSAERIVADINRHFAPFKDAQDHRAAAAADRQSRQFERLQLPPAGSRTARLYRTDEGEGSAARGGRKSPVLQDVYVEGLSPGPQVELIIDREKAAALGVTFEDINNTISANLGSAYINDFPNRGRMQRVVVQSDQGRPHAGRARS